MKFLVVPDDEGQYVNPEGEHFNVIYGGFVVGPRASEFKEFDTLKHALEYYNLVDPNAPVEEEKEEEQAEEVAEETSEEQPTVSKMESVEDNFLQDLTEQTDAESVVTTEEQAKEIKSFELPNED